MLNYLYFSSSSLTKKAVGFILIVVVSTLSLPLWAGVLLLLLYVGGLFIVLTYIITFSFFQEKITFLVGGRLVILLRWNYVPFIRDKFSFYIFEPLLGESWVCFPLFLLVGGLLLISLSTPAGKRVRGGF